MPSYTIYANADDYETNVGSPSYSGARDASGNGNPYSGGPYNTAALYYNSSFSTYYCYQAFFHFDTSAVVGTVASASIVVTRRYNSSGDVEFREKTWTSADGSNHTAGTSLGSLTLFGPSGGAGGLADTTYTVAKSSPATLPITSAYGLMMHATRQRTDTTYVADASFTVRSAETSGTTNDPYLSITTAEPRKAPRYTSWLM